MKKYQILEVQNENNTAGTKAVNDAAKIAEKKGFKALPIRVLPKSTSFMSKVKKQLQYAEMWKNIYSQVSPHAVIFLQNPFHYVEAGRYRTLKRLKKKKHVKYICLVHDVEELRKLMWDSYHEKEFTQMLDYADVLIVHNERMKSYFLEKGFPGKNIVVLSIFDYLISSHSCVRKAVGYQRMIIAGNLNAEKSGYLAKLSLLKKVPIILYGPNFDSQLICGSNIHYYGVFSPDQLPIRMQTGFGLVWDGDEIDTCTGYTGNYLRYNNPHKLSLFIASGIPVVIWKQAAEAEFVIQNHLGYTVESLQEAEEKVMACSPEQYEYFLLHVKLMQDLLTRGVYLQKSLERAVKLAGLEE